MSSTFTNKIKSASSLGVPITTGPSHAIDSFGRWRVSEPVTIFESQMQYNDCPILWETVLSGGATTTYLPDEASLELTCGTASGDSVIRQTYQYLRYQPGKAHLIMMTGVLGEGKANVVKRIGYFDGYNGIFFEQEGTQNKVVVRSSTGGSPIDDIVLQGNWSLDTLDGEGESGITLDSSKAQIYVMDLQWLGVGKVRFGYVSHGLVIYCHEFVHANLVNEVYMTTANLPLRYEIENIDTAATSTSMKQICATAVSEGGVQYNTGFLFSASTGATPAAITTRASVLSIRPKDTFNSIKNRGSIIPLNFQLLVATNPVFYEVIYKGAVTSASWTSVNAESITEYSTTKNTVTGGVVISSGFINAGAGPQMVSVASAELRDLAPLGSDFAGTAQDELIIVCTSTSGTASVYASIGIRERR